MLLLLLLAVGSTLTSEVSNEGKQINKEDTEVKTILVKDFDEGTIVHKFPYLTGTIISDSEDDRILHFKMTDDHNCKDGICDDGDFMLTDMPEFAKVRWLNLIIKLPNRIICL